MSAFLARNGLRVIMLAYLAIILVGPLAFVFKETFADGFGPAWDALTTPATINAFKLTLIITAIAVPVNTVFGVVTEQLFRRQGQSDSGQRLDGVQPVDRPMAIAIQNTMERRREGRVVVRPGCAHESPAKLLT